jgi:hypothetical protein
VDFIFSRQHNIRKLSKEGGSIMQKIILKTVDEFNFNNIIELSLDKLVKFNIGIF